MSAEEKAAPAVPAEAPTERSCCKHKKRQMILEAAARAFAHERYHKVRTDDIASAAGVGKGTLFRYFASKEELFVATLLYSVDIASAEIELALAGLNEPLERLETLCEKLVAFYRENDHLYHLFHHQKALHDRGGHEEFGEKQKALRAKVAEIIRAGQAAGRFRQVDPVIAGRLLFGMLRTALRSPDLKDRTPHDIARIILDLFIRGAGKCRAEAPGEAAPPGGADR